MNFLFDFVDERDKEYKIKKEKQRIKRKRDKKIDLGKIK